ncbi:putative pyroglutamyl peptidase type I [Coniochaeta ligniaria NRRL 30616]|uniref:Putative pyroglutamyl peptidase type I n=1 Tax=Coniochaeta ligniaria NRRL 30616 TaxID=1408157 RepID=A0A1J7J7K5_9PEZI|nr:putative pyroglutamyl peptidase type I [Coniochaeta ligniaria NRRL 30616]
MGSTSDPEEFIVLVTGFGPFKENFPVNPSWAIASKLPEYLPPLRPKAAGTAAASELPPVRILVHPEPIRVNYQTVRATVPGLWDLEGKSGRPRIDLAVHIGMAGPRPMYQLECRGHRDGYAMKDVDGQFLGDQERHAAEGEDWIWHAMPKELETDLDVHDVLERWKKHSPDGLDLRISQDAGRYLCDFIYYSSLAHLVKAGEKRKVVFLHVPADLSERAIATGRELAVQLIRSLVESELSRKSAST